MTELGSAEYVIAVSTLVGPLLAVQAQKYLERWREKENRRLTIFRVLMSTRPANLSAAHVEAINAIPLEFYRKKAVMDAWLEYFTHLRQSDRFSPEIWGQNGLSYSTNSYPQ
jgi:hypothetical protein